MPPNTVSVCRPGKWGNPFAVGKPYETVGAGTFICRDAEEAVRLYRPVAWCHADMIAADLRGKNLACWCPLEQPCHADVLLELANRPSPPSKEGE